MGKMNIFTLLVTVVVQFMVGYLWYSSYLFGDVMTTGGHTVDFLKLDVLSLLLIILGSYGLTHMMDMLINLTHTKDVGGSVKLGLTVGTLGIGFPIIMLLNLMGFSKVILLVVFMHLVLVTILTTITVLKLKKV